ncbi:cytochrome P450 [Fomitopsis betulina]|nr:cytochrome P450 [Fomitopsis betulina]
MTTTVPLLLVAIAVFLLFFSKRRQHTLPPGPKPLPFIGNVHQLPAVDQHKTFAQWGAQYGDVVFVKFFQQPVIILNSAKAAIDLMEKRGAIYSGRPRLTYMRELFTAAVIFELGYGRTITASSTRVFPRRYQALDLALEAAWSTFSPSSLTPLIIFILEMTLHPEVLKMAQDEISCVVGDSRLPDFADRPQLLYIECILRELHLYFIEDDMYRGYHIPKGATVISNIWAMMRDTDHYADPDVFRPERFFEIAQDSEFVTWDPKKLVFSFGRRVCPGAPLADNSVWLAISRVIATLDIRKARDETGAEITPNPVLRSGTVTHPEPFLCDIRPPSEKARQLILDCRIDTGDIKVS